MRIGNLGNFGFSRHEEPGFNHTLLQIGTAAKKGRNLNHRRIMRQVGNIFSRSQKKAPEIIHSKGLFEKIHLGINNLNEWAPASGLVFAIVGAIVFNERRAFQVTGDLKSLEKKVDKGFDKLEVKMDKLEAKLDKIEKIALISFGSYGTYLFFKICEAKARQ